MTNIIWVTNTNWVTQTNSITAWHDPALWVGTIGAIATGISAFLMFCSVQQIKKQSASVQLLEYEKKYNETLFEILMIRNEEGGEESEELKELVKLYFILITCLNSACRIYFTDKSLYGKLFESIFKEKVEIFISGKSHNGEQSEYEFLKNNNNFLESTELMKYCKEQNIKIPELTDRQENKK